MWLQVINKVKVTHQGKGHIKVKVKYLHPFKFYVAHALCKRVVCIRLKCYSSQRIFNLQPSIYSSSVFHFLLVTEKRGFLQITQHFTVLTYLTNAITEMELN